MSLVAYGSSDESSDDEVNPKESDTQNETVNKTSNSSNNVEGNIQKNSKTHMSLPVPKNAQISIEFEEKEATADNGEIKESGIGFGALPKPINYKNNYEEIPEDDDIPLFKPKQISVEKSIKKERIPAKISIPSLSEFKDVDEDLQKNKDKPTASKLGTGLFAILPPPKTEIITKKNTLIPHAVTKSVSNSVANKTISAPKIPLQSVEKSIVTKVIEKEPKKLLPALDYDSNSEDDDGGHGDFFSLSKPVLLPEPVLPTNDNLLAISKNKGDDSAIEHEKQNVANFTKDLKSTENVGIVEIERPQSSTLISTVMDLPREEILLKNKAEVGPKLPVPEQEYNVDSEGNVAFDEKAIEYLCGKRGVKRKNKMIDEANIIEINGEDIKPDEREWLVKALTEEPVQRPVSMQGAGPSSQSKKKHQITYLAHQAKAMEVELKNTWSQNRMARKQTQSKYGF